MNNTHTSPAYDLLVFFFFFNDTATTEIYTLSLHDALPIPTESLTRSAGTSSGEPAAEAWVILAGCSISDSTPPSDSPSVNNLVRPHIATAASAPPACRNDTIPPKPRICFAATSW